MSHNHEKTQRQILEYMVTFTQKLSHTFKDLSEMGSELLRALNHNDRSERYKNRHREKEPEKEKDDLNSNLIGEEDEDGLNANINGRKKLKLKNRIQEAEEEQDHMVNEVQNKAPLHNPPSKQIKKLQEKPDKQKLVQPHQKQQDSKKKSKQISHKPKAPTSSFLLFFKQQQQSIAKSYPNYGVVELTKVAAKCWNELAVEEKDPYQKLFEVERKKYQEEMEKYKKMFPEEVKRKQLEKKEKKKKRAKERREKEGREGKEVKQAKQSKPPKQKPIPIISNSDINPYSKMTPGVKLQDLGIAGVEKDKQGYEYYEQEAKNEEEMASDELESLDGDSEENSLGEDI